MEKIYLQSLLVIWKVWIVNENFSISNKIPVVHSLAHGAYQKGTWMNQSDHDNSNDENNTVSTVDKTIYRQHVESVG
jgi:hypothetical protein